ncbi:glycosyltransferase family 4 protein [Haloarcula salinisoli]|uniref:Glycosyltransferase family 4 protein n=1 Tax=Haloarcula salinisoli TaxID=2487746 RepID=A0A8J7YMB3_9EURY|nr:glycosyltransferase family 4 protein [Halomicroarcula salinisoli]MBX0288257.1 glycosyltransferase family 4 protein [Halomicroarcula salinisoli]MBX0305419.1 glycosyltransferase family 4 protein [Halomicroarcula salinisoli]
MHAVLVLTTGEGGIPHYTAELANSLHEIGNKVTVVKPDETTADEFFSSGVETKEWFSNPNVSFSKISELDLSVTNVVKSCLSLRELSRIPELNPDVVHFTHKPHSYLRPFLPNIDVSVPIVETRHETENTRLLRIPGRDLPAQENMKVVAAMNVDSVLRHTFDPIQTDRYIAHTEQNKTDLQEKYPDSPVETIPHGAFRIFAPEADTTPAERDPDENTILFFGNITGYKDLNQLVEATIRLGEEINDLTTVIAGSGNLPDGTSELVDAHPDLFDIKNEFIPNAEVPELFAQASVVVVPHIKQQGHSGTMTIAFAHGTPVVATTVGEYDQLIRKSGSGYTVEPGDDEMMANSLSAILQNSELRRSMGKNSKRMAAELSWDSVAKQTEQFYQAN